MTQKFFSPNKSLLLAAAIVMGALRIKHSIVIFFFIVNYVLSAAWCCCWCCAVLFMVAGFLLVIVYISKNSFITTTFLCFGSLSKKEQKKIKHRINANLAAKKTTNFWEQQTRFHTIYCATPFFCTSQSHRAKTHATFSLSNPVCIQQYMQKRLSLTVFNNE